VELARGVWSYLHSTKVFSKFRKFRFEVPFDDFSKYERTDREAEGESEQSSEQKLSRYKI